ncbi:MAG: hypothetical protein HKO71_00610 [Pseudomonadales bacterium]|nr:hypothetical protein [Pseudomonadales bacterium]
MHNKDRSRWRCKALTGDGGAKGTGARKVHYSDHVPTTRLVNWPNV